MAASDRDDALDRLIEAAPGQAVPEDLGDFADDIDLQEMAALAHTLRASGRAHAREVNPAAGWAALSAAIEQTPQARRGWFAWWPTNLAVFQQFAPFPAVAAAAVILGISLLLAVPQENASAALMRDVDAMERTIAAVSAHGSVSEEDRVELERTATAVLDRVSDETILRSVPAAQVEAIAARLEEARRTLVTLPETEASPSSSSSALASLSAASGFVESSLSAIVAPTPSAEPKAASKSAPKPTPKPTLPPTRTPAVAAAQTSTPTRTPTSAPTASPTPRPTSTPAANDRSGNDNSGPNRAAPQATPSVATLVDTVAPVCARVYNASSLGSCRKAVEAAQAWCDQLGSDSSRGCARTIGESLEAAERRVSNLSDGCKRLSNSRSQKACQDSIEMSSYRPSRGNSGNTGRGDRGD